MIFVSSIDKTYKISPRLTAWNEFHTFCGNERSRRGSAGIGEANPSRGRGDVGAKRPSVSALGGKSKVKPNGRRRCDGADYETVVPIISKKV